jgi:hypothetical protein
MAHPVITASVTRYGGNSKRMNPWAEVKLDLNYDPPSGAWQSDNRGTMTIELTRDGARAVEDAIREGMRPQWAGKSIVGIFMDALLEMAVSLRDGTAEDPAYVRGRAAGLAYAVALMRNPYEPNERAVREDIKERLGIEQTAQRKWLDTRTMNELRELAAWYCKDDIEPGMKKDDFIELLDEHDLEEEMS